MVIALDTVPKYNFMVFKKHGFGVSQYVSGKCLASVDTCPTQTWHSLSVRAS